MHKQSPADHKRRILFISLEFNYSPFSGNGVLARSLVSGLIRSNAQSHDIQIRVICGRPHPLTNDLSPDVSLKNSEHKNNSLEIWPVELPKGCQWKRLDRYGPWKEFVEECARIYGGADYAQRVNEFKPTEVLVVDWHGMLAWENISVRLKDMEQAHSDRSWRPSSARVCYYNFRVYSASLWDHQQTTNDITDEKDEQFYAEKEQLCCRLADLILCLSEHDRRCLQHLIKEDIFLSSKEISVKTNTIQILPPPLRGDILELASRDFSELISHLPDEANAAIQQLSKHKSDSTSRRVFITCMVRLSPEKTPHNFVVFLRKIGGIKFLKSAGLIPLICGAKSVQSYAKCILDDFVALCSSGTTQDSSWPCVVIDRFLGPKEMAAVFSCSAINLHPCLNDAYGMTIVESAAFGAVSIVNKGGSVGATSLLKEGIGCVGVDMNALGDDNSNSLLECIEQIKTHHTSFNKIRENGRSSAIGWHEEVYCSSLLTVLSNNVD